MERRGRRVASAQGSGPPALALRTFSEGRLQNAESKPRWGDYAQKSWFLNFPTAEPVFPVYPNQSGFSGETQHAATREPALAPARPAPAGGCCRTRTPGC